MPDARKQRSRAKQMPYPGGPAITRVFWEAVQAFDPPDDLVRRLTDPGIRNLKRDGEFMRRAAWEYLTKHFEESLPRELQRVQFRSAPVRAMPRRRPSSEPDQASWSADITGSAVVLRVRGLSRDQVLRCVRSVLAAIWLELDDESSLMVSSTSETEHEVQLGAESAATALRFRAPATGSGSPAAIRRGLGDPVEELKATLGDFVFVDEAGLCWHDKKRYTIDGCSAAAGVFGTLRDWRRLLLAIMYEWWGAKDDWARRRMKLGDGVLEFPQEGWFVVDPERVARLFYGKPIESRNWRNQLAQRIRSLAGLQQQHGQRTHRLFDGFVDGLQQTVPRPSAEADLFHGLRAAGCERSPLFFLKLSPEMQAKLPVHVTHEGRVSWLGEANAAAKQKAAAGRLIDDDPLHPRNIKKRHQERSYFRIGSEVFTTTASLSDRQFGLLVTLLSQPTGLRSGESDAAHPLNGSQGLGYRIARWMTIAGYGEDEHADFLHDLAALGECGITYRVRGRPMHGPALNKLARRKKQPVLQLNLRAYLTTTAEDNRPPSKDIEQQDLRQDLLVWRTEQALGQEEIARRIGVSRPLISQWETGKRKISRKHAEQVRSVLSPPVEKATA